MVAGGQARSTRAMSESEKYFASSAVGVRVGVESALVKIARPDFANELARWMQQHPGNLGILICGSGIGMSMAANRHNHIRAALCYNGLAAQLARRHNDANVLCMGARMMGPDMAKFCLKQFLETAFEGGRHIARIEKMQSPQ